MPDCPHCHQSVASDAVSCPYCRTPLKAFGHPGIPLYQATGSSFLCDRCLYHEDDSCNYPQRPYAKTCTLFQDKFDKLNIVEYQPSLIQNIKAWSRRNQALIFILTLLLISIILAIT